MLLREIFEIKGKTTVGIIFGRFNPPHKGHRAAWEMASQNDHWFIGTNESTQGPKDPLPYKVKIEAMKTIWPEIKNHIVSETSWLTLASKIFKEYGDVTLNVYTDEDWVTKTIIQYNGKEGPHGFYNFKEIQQQATPRLSSATALRDAVVQGDRDAFSDAAGIDANTDIGGHSFFDVVAHYLLPYQNAPKKVVKKKEKVTEKEDSKYIPVKTKLCPNCKRSQEKCLCSQRESKTPFAGAKVGHKEGPAGQWRNKGPSKNRPAKVGDLVGGSMEETAGVGIITKQNTTKDVNKGTLHKMMKGYKLI